LIKFTEPKISNTGQEWFVFFRAVNPETEETKLFKFKQGLNIKSLTKKERTSAANDLRFAYSDLLKNGWNPFTGKQTNPELSITLCQAFDNILETKRSSMKKKSVRNYTDISNMFQKWLKAHGYGNILPQRFTNKIAREYFDYLLVDRKYSGKSHNTQLGILKAFFNGIIERDQESYKSNPFVGIKELKEDHGKNFPFSEMEKDLLKSKFEKNDPHYYAACMFVYFCFLRRSELIELQVKDIDLVKMTVTVSSLSAKNRTQQSVTIPRAMESIVKSMNLENFPSDWYVFGRYCKVSKDKTKKPDFFSYKFRIIANKLKIDKTKGFYAFKHSGVCALFTATKDPYVVMSQCRHSDIKITMIYLRSMGLTVSEQVRNADFGF